MRYLSLSEILELHERIVSSSGGSHGIRDIKSLESSINQPRQTFEQNDLYPNTVSKAAALCFFLVKNHAFIDGNKRIGHAAAYSARFRPAIPEEAGHPFRLIPATHSGASRPPIPDDSGHPH
jgi:hypothetical protein